MPVQTFKKAMDLQKAKIFLEKINREFTLMQRDPETISSIDVDILRQYIRDFYDAVLSEKTSVLVNPPTQPVKEQLAPKQSSRPIGFNPERTQQKTPAPPQEIILEEKPRPIVSTPPVEEVVRPKQTPVFEAEPIIARAPEPLKKETPAPAPPPEPVVAKVEEPISLPKPPQQNAAINYSAETLALFEFKAPKELSEKLSETPIADLKKAFSLNDRLLMTRELFGGDAKALENTVSTLQNLTSFEDAKSFLIQFCAEQFDWSNKNRVEPARHFIKIVRRRFAS